MDFFLIHLRFAFGMVTTVPLRPSHLTSMASLLLASTARTAAASSSRRLVASSSSALDTLPLLLSALPPLSSILPPLPSSSRSISSRNPNFSKGLTKVQRKRGQMKKRLNLEKHALLERVREETKPDPVLGYRPGNTREVGTNNEDLWNNCELRKIIISNQDVWGLREDSRGNLQPVESELTKGTEEERAVAASEGGPLRLNFNLSDEDRKLLFQDLPDVNTKDRLTVSMAFSDAGSGTNAGSMIADEINQQLEGIERQEGHSVDKLSRMLDLRNASSKGIDVYNKRRIVEQFGQGVHTGTVETQGELMRLLADLL